MTCWRRLRGRQQVGVWHELHQVLLHTLGNRDAIQWSLATLVASSMPANRGSASPGPTPTNRAQPGSTPRVVVDAQGLPLAVSLSAANVHDAVLFEPVVYALEAICRQWGRPRTRPTRLHGDMGYNYSECCRPLLCRTIRPRMARWGIKCSDKLGRQRWLAERSLAWLRRCRLLMVPHERRANIEEASLHLGCTLICLSAPRHWFSHRGS